MLKYLLMNQWWWSYVVSEALLFLHILGKMLSAFSREFDGKIDSDLTSARFFLAHSGPLRGEEKSMHFPGIC